MNKLTTLLDLWNCLNDSQKVTLVSKIQADLKEIEFWKTHRIVGKGDHKFVIPVYISKKNVSLSTSYTSGGL